MMNRRQALGLMAACASPVLVSKTARAVNGPTAGKTGLGIVIYCCQIRRSRLQKEDPRADLFEPFAFLEHCWKLGAGGVQVPLGVLAADRAAALRERAEEAGMFIEAIAQLPRDSTEVGEFEARIQTAARAGARAVRTTIIPGRRYEYFDSLDRFREFESRGRKSLELAAPVAEKHGIPLAVENHKDHRNAERVTLLRHIGSEYVGACLDVGNSISLLEDPIETVEALAPWAHTVHLKDQAVRAYRDGFLLGDIPLGQGFLDLEKIAGILRGRKPGIHFNLELITRDPLKVPCLTEKYWATFPDVPGRDLARTLRSVRDHAADSQQEISSLSADQQLAREDANIRASLDYARERLGL